MSINGNRVFRSLLLIEAIANISAIFPLILSPRMCLLYLVKHPLQITSTTLSLAQWSGALLVLASIPLLISYSEPTSDQRSSLVTDRRRMAFWTLGATEVVLGIVAASQYQSGDSGITDVALLIMMGTFASYIGMRVFFLFIKPEWMEAKAGHAKTR